MTMIDTSDSRFAKAVCIADPLERLWTEPVEPLKRRGRRASDTRVAASSHLWSHPDALE